VRLWRSISHQQARTPCRPVILLSWGRVLAVAATREIFGSCNDIPQSPTARGFPHCPDGRGNPGVWKVKKEFVRQKIVPRALVFLVLAGVSWLLGRIRRMLQEDP
jgi:hypothetical protein